MSLEILIWLVLAVLLIIGTPIFVSLGMASIAVLLLSDIPLSLVMIDLIKVSDMFPLLAVVGFVFAGALMERGGMAAQIVEVASMLVGHIRGGLGMVTILGCMFFASMIGSGPGTVAAMGSIMIPSMIRRGYSPEYAAGVSATGGTLGILIPPSTVMIIYGIITEQSIGKLFMAGMLPGILQMLLYMAVIRIWVRRFPEAGPAAGSCRLKEKVQSLSRVWSVILLMVLVVGGLYTGIFSPNEAGGVGAFGAFVIGLILCRKTSRRQFLKESLIDTVRTQGMCLSIMLGAMIFGYFLTVSRLPMTLSDSITSVVSSPMLILIFILLIMVLLGCFMDSMAIILLTVPIFYPLIQSVGIDPIWFGILVVRVTEMGLITPPVGLNLYVIQGVSNVPMGRIFSGVIPFILCDVLHVVILLSFPIISLWLPGMM